MFSAPLRLACFRAASLLSLFAPAVGAVEMAAGSAARTGLKGPERVAAPCSRAGFG